MTKEGPHRLDTSNTRHVPTQKDHLTMKISLTLAILSITTSIGCYGSPDDPAQSADLLNSANTETLIIAGRAQLGTTQALQCKPWVSSIASSSLSITVPSTTPNASGLAWASSTAVTQRAQWLGSYAVQRYAGQTVTASGTFNGTVQVPNGDPYILVLYGPATLRGSIINASGTAVTSVAGTDNGALSPTFTGSATYTLRVTNSARTSATFTAVVLSRSRFVSDYNDSASRGNVIQMRVRTSSTASTTPHTAFIQVNGNTGTNWLDANWVDNYTTSTHPAVANKVGEHAVDVNQMIRFTARSADLGFTIYSLNDPPPRTAR